MIRPALATAAAVLAAVAGCTSVVNIYDYSGGGKTRVDTVYVESSGDSTVAPAPPPGGGAPVPPPGGGSEPVPPGGPGGGGIEHPGRWSSITELHPGTARLETVVAPIDSLVIYRVLGNTINGRGTDITVELDPETRRNTVTGERKHFLSLEFDSHSSWTDASGDIEILRIDCGGETVASFGIEDASGLVPVPRGDGSYRIEVLFPAELDLLRTLALSERTILTVSVEPSRTGSGVLSEDNRINLSTFFSVYASGEGSKSPAPGGVEPAVPESPSGGGSPRSGASRSR
ncbi:hypothetical protein GX411_00070 [Candidatus Fermentibacteria bacterium]|nr:hypothetical protein [Candidatus Fermentibacteria bacterium]